MSMSSSGPCEWPLLIVWPRHLLRHVMLFFLFIFSSRVLSGGSQLVRSYLLFIVSSESNLSVSFAWGWQELCTKHLSS